MSIATRFMNLFRRHRVALDIDREMSFHLAERADDLMAAGLSREDAMQEAKRRFGNTVFQKESTRDADLLTWLETFIADLRYAMRALIASPLFALIAILSLALGIGANTAIFSLINAVMLKTLPVRNPEQLVQVTFSNKPDDHGVFTNPLWEALRDRQDVFSGVFAYGDNQFNLAEGGEARNVNGNLVSGEFFPTLAVRPAAGRMLSKADDFRGCPGAAVLGYGLWKSEFGGDRAAIGKSIMLNGHRFPIVGVTDKSFFGVDVGRTAQVYLPLCAETVLNNGEGNLDLRSTWWLHVIGRPAEGQTIESVRARLTAIAPAAYQATIPEKWSTDMQTSYAKRSFWAKPAGTGLSYLRGEYSKALFALMVIVSVVLIIACANVANLLLARATARQREVAVRLALGAGRRRLVRQLLTESLLLSSIGAALGVLFARWFSTLLVSYLSSHNDQVWLDLTLDKRVLAFTIGVATFTGVLFGLAPAWRASRVEPQAVMKANGRSVVQGHSRFNMGKALVIAQIALSLILVTGATLLLGSFRRLATMDPGFESDGVLIATIDMSTANLPGERQRPAYLNLLERARQIHGVKAAAIGAITPVGGSSWNDEIVVDGFTPKGEEDALSWINQVSENYFATYGMRMVAGRDFNKSDVVAAPKVAVVNEAFAKHFFGTTNVVGRHFSTQLPASKSPPIQIIGVVADSKYNDLKKPNEPIGFLSMNQDSAPGRYFRVALKTSGDAAALIPGFKSMAAELDPTASLDFVKLKVQLAESIARERLLATLSAFFGGLALVLAMIGLYGIMSYNVARRRGEIGIRMALGSGRSEVMQMVLREVTGLVVAGVLIGGIGVMSGMKLIESFLFGLSPTDPRVLALSAVVLGVVALVAGAIPAWRAGRVDPMDALREE